MAWFYEHLLSYVVCGLGGCLHKATCGCDVQLFYTLIGPTLWTVIRLMYCRNVNLWIMILCFVTRCCWQLLQTTGVYRACWLPVATTYWGWCRTQWGQRRTSCWRATMRWWRLWRRSASNASCSSLPEPLPPRSSHDSVSSARPTCKPHYAKKSLTSAGHREMLLGPLIISMTKQCIT